VTLSRRVGRRYRRKIGEEIHKGTVLMLYSHVWNRAFTHRQSDVSYDPIHSLPFTAPTKPWEDSAPFDARQKIARKHLEIERIIGK